MKKIAIALALITNLGSVVRAQGPYVQGIWSKGNPIYTSAGMTFTTNKFVADKGLTAVAVTYHRLQDGSFWDLPKVASHEPDWIKPYLPREAWACQVGGSYGKGAEGQFSGNGAIGCGVNILASVRQEVANILSNWDSTQALGKQIAPGNGPGDIFIGRVWQDDATRPLILAPRWAIQASYGF